MLYYPSKRYTSRRNYYFEPDVWLGRAMLNPTRYVSRINPRAHVLMDSGAFQDIDTHIRLSPQAALDRQITYLEKLRKAIGIPTYQFEAISIYDQMCGVDEAIIDGRKQKIRGNHDSAKVAIEETLFAAQYYHDQQLDMPVIYIAQGIDTQQYVYDCALPLLELMRPTDYFGMGGFCIIGRKRKIMFPLFQETCKELFPHLVEYGVKRVHMFGVLIPRAVEFFANLCKEYNIIGSTDGSSPELSAMRFKRSYSGHRDVFGTEIGRIPYVNYIPTELARANIMEYNNWIQSL